MIYFGTIYFGTTRRAGAGPASRTPAGCARRSLTSRDERAGEHRALVLGQRVQDVREDALDQRVALLGQRLAGRRSRR